MEHRRVAVSLKFLHVSCEMGRTAARACCWQGDLSTFRWRLAVKLPWRGPAGT